MPVVTCPKCPTKLKIPDGVSGNTKCPKCGTVFPVGQVPSFEVVDDKPAPAQKSVAAAPKPPSKPAAKVEIDEEPDFEVVEDEGPKKKRVTADEDDEDDAPRKKKSRYHDDEDEDDDRPSSKKAKKKKKKRYDDDDDYWQPQPGGRSAFAKGRTGALLISISFWLNLATYGLLSLYALIVWIGVIAATSSSPSSRRGGGGGGGGGSGVSMESALEIIVLVPSLLGLAAWVVGIIGSSFSIGGPAKARGMAITATVFAGVHLLLMGVTFSNMYGDRAGFGPGGMGIGSPAWLVLSSALPVLDSFLPILVYQSRAINGEYVIALLAAVCEVARLIFLLLTLKALAGAARDFDAGERARLGLTIACFIIGGAAILILLVVVVVEQASMGLKSVLHVGVLTLLLTYIAYTLMMLAPALAAGSVKDACDRRT